MISNLVPIPILVAIIVQFSLIKIVVSLVLTQHYYNMLNLKKGGFQEQLFMFNKLNEHCEMMYDYLSFRIMRCERL